MTVAEEHLHDEVHQRKMALFRARGGEDLEGGEGVKMTPELARGILDLPERDQKELLTQTGNKESQMRILETVVLSAEGHAAEDGHDIHGHTEHHGLSGHHGHHVATPAQNRVQRQWALIFVTAIVTASVTFETLKEITIENTPPTMIKVCDAMMPCPSPALPAFRAKKIALRLRRRCRLAVQTRASSTGRLAKRQPLLT